MYFLLNFSSSPQREISHHFPPGAVYEGVQRPAHHVLEQHEGPRPRAAHAHQQHDARVVQLLQQRGLRPEVILVVLSKG